MSATISFKSVEEIVKNFRKGTFGVVIVALTEPSMPKSHNANKELGIPKEINPFKDNKVQKITIMRNVALGYDYQRNVNLRLERKGIDKTIETKKPSGKSWFDYPYILQSVSNNEKHYLRCTMRPSMKSVSVYLIDGQLCKDEKQLNELKKWTEKKSSSKKQAALGLSEEEQVKVFDYSVDSILIVEQGDKIYVNQNTPIGYAKIMSYFMK